MRTIEVSFALVAMVEVVTVLMMVVVWTVSWPQRWRERCPGIARYYSLSSPSHPPLPSPPSVLLLLLLLLLLIFLCRCVSLPFARRDRAFSLFLRLFRLALSPSVLLGQAFSPAFPRSFYRGLPRAGPERPFRAG